MKKIDIAISPCPNDTFAFHALLHSCVKNAEYTFSLHFHDVDTLNQYAEKARYKVTKLSYFAYLANKDSYRLLDAGSALGYGCGPLLVTGNAATDIRNMKIAVPGYSTTAFLLMKLWKPDLKNLVHMRFDQIIPAIQNKTVDAGLIIHEGRFLYKQHNLHKIIDLGEWWEETTHLPIPLGCIALRSIDSNEHDFLQLNMLIKQSIEYALNNPDISSEFVKTHATELDENTIKQHIQLYVNEFSLDLGTTGHKAVHTLESMIQEKGIVYKHE